MPNYARLVLLARSPFVVRATLFRKKSRPLAGLKRTNTLTLTYEFRGGTKQRQAETRLLSQLWSRPVLLALSWVLLTLTIPFIHAE